MDAGHRCAVLVARQVQVLVGGEELRRVQDAQQGLLRVAVVVVGQRELPTLPAGLDVADAASFTPVITCGLSVVLAGPAA